MSLAARLCEQFIEFVVDTLHGCQDTVQSGIDSCPVQLPVFGRGFRYNVDFLRNALVVFTSSSTRCLKSGSRAAILNSCALISAVKKKADLRVSFTLTMSRRLLYK